METIKFRNILLDVSGIKMDGQRRVSTKEKDGKKAQRLADQLEKASRTKLSFTKKYAIANAVSEAALSTAFVVTAHT